LLEGLESRYDGDISHSRLLSPTLLAKWTGLSFRFRLVVETDLRKNCLHNFVVERGAPDPSLTRAPRFFACIGLPAGVSA